MRNRLSWHHIKRKRAEDYVLGTNRARGATVQTFVMSCAETPLATVPCSEVSKPEFYRQQQRQRRPV